MLVALQVCTELKKRGTQNYLIRTVHFAKDVSFTPNLEELVVRFALLSLYFLALS